MTVEKSRQLIAATIAIVMFLFGSELSTWAKPPIPRPRTFPSGPFGEIIRLGETLVEQTAMHPLTKPHVGNALNCTSCHLKNGADLKAATFIGVATAYPAWSSKCGQQDVRLDPRQIGLFTHANRFS